MDAPKNPAFINRAGASGNQKKHLKICPLRAEGKEKLPHTRRRKEVFGKGKKSSRG